MTQQPNSLTELPRRPGQWPKGVSGNPKGQTDRELTVKQWLTRMKGFTELDLMKVFADKESPALKLTAARQMFRGIQEAGRTADFEALRDTLDGKPTQEIVQTIQQASTIDLDMYTLEELQQMADIHAAAKARKLAQQQAQAALPEPIEVQAEHANTPPVTTTE